MRLHVKINSTYPNSSALYQTKKGGLGQLRKASKNSMCQIYLTKAGKREKDFKTEIGFELHFL